LKAEEENETMPMIISKNGDPAELVERSTFRNEAMLQEYIHKNPESIPVCELEEDKKLLVAAREFLTNSGPIDALAVDKDGDLYVVETKLYRNTDKRAVLAQALDYGASLWKHSADYNEFVGILDRGCRKAFGVDFRQKAMDFFEIDDEQTEAMMESLRSNLNEGIIKFVIVMDSIDERLKDLILYVNQNSKFDIYAVELDYYEYEEYQIIIPRLFGVEVRKPLPRKFTSYDKESWYVEFKERRPAGEVEIVRSFEDLANLEPFGFDYSSMRVDSRATFWIFSDKARTCRIFGFRVDGKVEFRFDKIMKYPPFDNEPLRRDFLDRLKKIPDFPGNFNLTGRPSFPISLLGNQDAMAHFFSAIQWCVQEIGNA